MGSKSNSTQATNNYDQRVAVQDGIGISGDRNSITETFTTNTSTTNNITDGGIVSRGLGTVDNAVDRALKSVDLAGANNQEGFNKLLGVAESLWTKSEGLIGQTQKSVADAYSQAQTDKAGTIDNKTIIVLAVAGAAALAFASRKG